MKSDWRRLFTFFPADLNLAPEDKKSIFTKKAEEPHFINFDQVNILGVAV